MQKLLDDMPAGTCITMVKQDDGTWAAKCSAASNGEQLVSVEMSGINIIKVLLRGIALRWFKKAKEVR